MTLLVGCVLSLVCDFIRRLCACVLFYTASTSLVCDFISRLCAPACVLFCTLNISFVCDFLIHETCVMNFLIRSKHSSRPCALLLLMTCFTHQVFHLFVTFLIRNMCNIICNKCVIVMVFFRFVVIFMDSSTI